MNQQSTIPRLNNNKTINYEYFFQFPSLTHVERYSTIWLMSLQMVKRREKKSKIYICIELSNNPHKYTTLMSFFLEKNDSIVDL